MINTIPDDSLLVSIQRAIRTMLRRDRYTVVLAALCAATGCSPAELLKSRMIKFSPDNPYSIVCSSNSDQNEKLLITLIEGSTVIESLTLLKGHPDVQSLLRLPFSQINSRCLPHLNRIVKHYLPFENVEEMYSAYSSLTSHFSIINPTSTSSKKNTQNRETLPNEELVIEIKSNEQQRLSEIASSFNIELSEIISVLLDWGETALLLKQRLSLSEPKQLLDWYKSSSSQTPQVLPISIPLSNREDKGPQDQNSQLEKLILTQQQSLAQLTQAISQLTMAILEGISNSQQSSHLMQTLAQQNNNPEKTNSVVKVPQQEDLIRNQSSVSQPPSMTSEDKVGAYIDAIMHYNNEVATTKKDKWLISISALKQLTKCNQNLIERVFEARSQEIETHHVRHQLNKFQNNKGKFAPSITEIIKLS